MFRRGRVFPTLIAALPAAVLFGCFTGSYSATAASVSPPMLDIARLCGAAHGHNATAMSECVVAESEARSEVLQKWAKLPDATAEKCKKLSGKAKRQYSALASCLLKN